MCTSYSCACVIVTNAFYNGCYNARNHCNENGRTKSWLSPVTCQFWKDSLTLTIVYICNQNADSDYINPSPKVKHNCFSKRKQKCLVKTNRSDLTLSSLSDVMVIKKTIRICSGLKSAVIKILHGER